MTASGRINRAGRRTSALALLLALSTINTSARLSAKAQTPPDRAPKTETLPTPSLPDSPSALLARSHSESATSPETATATDPPVVSSGDLESTSVMVPARKNHRVVRPYEEAGPLSTGDKLRLSIMSRISFGEAGATTIAAGWAQVTNTRPHTGTDSGAFGERLGDLAIKQTTQSILTYGIFAAAFHDDPRYYVLGDTKPILRRALYSARGVVIARKDDGSSAINWPRFAGIAGATALTNAYYPTVDHGLDDSIKAFTSSLGSAFLNNELHEFSGDLVHLLPGHHNH